MTWEDFKHKYDSIQYGVVFGILTSFLGAFGSKWYLTNSWNYDWGRFIYHMSEGESISDFLILMIIPNVLTFYFMYFHWRMDDAAKGIVFMTLLSVGLMLLISGL